MSAWTLRAKASYMHRHENGNSAASFVGSLKRLPHYIDFNVTQPILAEETEVLLLPSLPLTCHTPKCQRVQGILVRGYSSNFFFLLEGIMVAWHAWYSGFGEIIGEYVDQNSENISYGNFPSKVNRLMLISGYLIYSKIFPGSKKVGA